MRVIPQLVSSPLTPIQIVEHCIFKTERYGFLLTIKTRGKLTRFADFTMGFGGLLVGVLDPLSCPGSSPGTVCPGGHLPK